MFRSVQQRKIVLKSQVSESLLKGNDAGLVRYVLNTGSNKRLGLLLNSKAKGRIDTLDFGIHQQELHFIPGWQEVFQSLFNSFPSLALGLPFAVKIWFAKATFSRVFSFELSSPAPRELQCQGGSGTLIPAEIFLSSTDLTIPAC